MRQQVLPVWIQVIFIVLLQCAITLCSCPPRCYCSPSKASCTSPVFPLVLPTGTLKLDITGDIGDLPKHSITVTGNKQLKSLTLKSARVRDIKPGALSGHKLKNIIFSNVTFERILANAFANSSAETVYFRQTNIRLILGEAFDNFKADHFHFFLSNITTIQSGSFSSLKLSNALTFSLCNLDEIKEAAFNVTFPLMLSMNKFNIFERDQSTFVIFSYNRMNCSCHLAWLWSPDYDYSDDLSYNRCNYPASLNDVYLNDVDPTALCAKDN